MGGYNTPDAVVRMSAMKYLLLKTRNNIHKLIYSFIANCLNAIKQKIAYSKMGKAFSNYIYVFVCKQSCLCRHWMRDRGAGVAVHNHAHYCQVCTLTVDVAHDFPCLEHDGKAHRQRSEYEFTFYHKRITGNMGQSPTWGRPTTQVRLQRQLFR